MSNVDLRDESKENKLFFQRMKACLTGNLDSFPFEVEGLTKLTDIDMHRAGYEKGKFKCLDKLNWNYKERQLNVVDDPVKRKLVRNYFEQDHITVLSNLPRERETVEVEGVPCLRRYYVDSIDNLITRFLNDKPEFASSRSSCHKILKSFKHFNNCSESERIHSACRYCRQMDMFVEVVNEADAFSESFLTRDALSKFATCEGPITEVDCIENKCRRCRDREGQKKAKERLEQLVVGSLNEEISWVVLTKDSNDRECEEQQFDTIQAFIDDLAKYLAFGCESSGSGKKPIGHLHRLLNMQLERRNLFKELDEDKELLVLEVDHGLNMNESVIRLRCQLLEWSHLLDKKYEHVSLIFFVVSSDNDNYFIAMGIGKEWGIETSEQHYQKSSYPLQSGIVWGWEGDRKLKMYYHNIGEVGLKKDGAYTG